MERKFGMVVMMMNVLGRYALCVVMIVGAVGLYPAISAADGKDPEFERVRRIYIEGARFMQEGRHVDAIPMLGQAHSMLTRAVEKGSKSKRVFRALRKLRYFLGTSLYKVGETKSKKAAKQDRAFTRKHFTRAVPLLQRYSKDGKSRKRRKEAAAMLLLARAWLVKHPKPITKVKPKFIFVGSKRGKIRAWPFIVLAAGVAIAGAGAVTAGLTLSTVGQRDDVYATLNAGKEPPSGEVAKLHQQAGTLATTSYILWGVGGGIAAAGIMLAIAFGRAPPPKGPLGAKDPKKSNASLLWKGDSL